MPVFNSIQFLQESIDSILCQSHADFEFIILDDGSTEPVWDLVQSCNGDFVMRHDADDISLPTRIEKELKFFKKDVGFVTCWYDNLILKNNVWKTKAQKYRITTEGLQSRYTMFNCGNDPGTMYSIEAVRKIGYFDERLYLGQTYNYNRRIQRFFKGEVVPEVLYLLRKWNGQVTNRRKKLNPNCKKVNWHNLANRYAAERLVIMERK
jgi:glycosyltransferase involved in cell wall biosynthesis